MTIPTPIVIDTVSAPRFDFTVRNNADWLQPFAFFNAYSPTAPWSNVDFWQPSQFYQSVLPASVVTLNGDLYVPSLAAPETWQSATTFEAEAQNWTRVGIASTYSSPPFDLTGCTLSMALAQLGSDGLTIAVPRKTIIKLSSNDPPPTINISSPPTNGVASLALLASSSVVVAAGKYGYDMNILKGGTTTTAVWGVCTVLQGAA